jgi:hypothetical protein
MFSTFPRSEGWNTRWSSSSAFRDDAAHPWVAVRPPQHAVWRIRRLARKAGINKPVGPHTLRHDVHHPRARASFDRHATYIVAAFVAGAAQ